MNLNQLSVNRLSSILVVLLLAFGFCFSGCSESEVSTTAIVSSKNLEDQQADSKTASKSNTGSEPESSSAKPQEPAVQVKEMTKKEKAMAAADKLRHQNLDSTLWMQTSGEYAALTRQTYQLAALGIQQALMDPTWTASLEQQEMVDAGEIKLTELPPAVVLDVDETCMDNSRFQVGLIEDKEQYSRERWRDFVKSKNSFAIPGAVNFLNRCRAAGIQVLFVTNREHQVEPQTRENMITEGLMLDSDADIIFTKLEKEDWKSDKINRRKFLASKYRILMLMGDDLHDFASLGYHPSSEKRVEFVQANASFWGHRWIVLPNPNYGGWEQSLYDWDYKKSEAEKLESKRSRLKH